MPKKHVISKECMEEFAKNPYGKALSYGQIVLADGSA
jgi:hypothetical protein